MHLPIHLGTLLLPLLLPAGAVRQTPLPHVPPTAAAAEHNSVLLADSAPHNHYAASYKCSAVQQQLLQVLAARLLSNNNCQLQAVAVLLFILLALQLGCVAT
jgi:hypothetical protein